MNRVHSLDTFRFMLALLVVWGHSWINLYQKIDNLGYHVEALAVDGFFILSGLLLAKSCYSIMQSTLYDADKEFLNLTTHRFKRLWPEYFFALLIVFIFHIIFNKEQFISIIPLNLLLIGQINKIPSILNGTWYVCLLFYVGTFLSALILYKKKTAIYIILPAIVLISLFYISSAVGHLVMHGATYGSFEYFPTGWLKAFLDLSLGILLYYIINNFKKLDLKNKYKNYFFRFIELIGIFFVIFPMTRSYCGFNDYLVLFGYSAIISVLYLQQEHLLKFFSYNIFRKISCSAYMLYLTHIVTLETIRDKFNYLIYPRYYIYSFIFLLSVTFSVVCYHTQKWLFAKLKQILFIPQAENSSLNVENPERERELCQASSEK